MSSTFQTANEAAAAHQYAEHMAATVMAHNPSVFHPRERQLMCVSERGTNEARMVMRAYRTWCDRAEAAAQIAYAG